MDNSKQMKPSTPEVDEVVKEQKCRCGKIHNSVSRICARCSSLTKEYRKRLYKERPWKRALDTARNKCADKSRKFHFKGIKFLMTEDEMKTLWFRDKAFLMKEPSIDRKDSSKHYTFDNCQYLELRLNSKKNGMNQYITKCRNAVEALSSIIYWHRKAHETPGMLLSSKHARSDECAEIMKKYGESFIEGEQALAKFNAPGEILALFKGDR